MSQHRFRTVRPVSHTYKKSFLMTFSLILLCSFNAQVSVAQKRGGRQAPQKNQPQEGVRDLFDAAQKLYQQGRYHEALHAYDRLLRQYPGHEPAVVQMAKTYYRIDSYQEAYQLFSRITPVGLDPETSYEYGWVFYNNKKWKEALSGFQRVPAGHALYDLANYYGAICAIRSRKYAQAEEMLEKAVVLPEKLAKTRTLYLKHVQELRLLHEKNRLARERKKARSRLMARLRKKRVPKSQATSTATTTLPSGSPKQYSGQMFIDTEARIQYGLQEQLIDYHGRREETFHAKIASFHLDAGPVWRSPWRLIGSPEPVVLGLNINLTAEDRNSTGREQRIIIHETTDELQHMMESPATKTHSKYGAISAMPYLDIPLANSYWLAFAYKISFKYPDYERSGRTGSRQFLTQWEGPIGPTTIYGQLHYDEILDSDTKPITTIFQSMVGLAGSPFKDLTVAGEAAHKAFNYEVEQPGPDSSSSATLIVEQVAPFGVVIFASGTYEYQFNYVNHDLPSYGNIASNANVLTGTVGLDIEPLPWIYASLKQTLSQTTWVRDDDITTDAFEINIPDYTSSFSAHLGVKLIF